MRRCNTIARYDDYIVVSECQKKMNGKKWIYHVIYIGCGGYTHPAYLRPSKTISVVIPLCNDIKPKQVKKRRVTCAGTFTTSVGLDEMTNIYGIRFNVNQPTVNFKISFKTKTRRKTANQPVGFYVNNAIYNYNSICSPGCEKKPCWFLQLFRRKKKK